MRSKFSSFATFGMVALSLLLCSGGVALAQGGEVKMAVIDSDRIVAESVKGQQALEGLKTLRDAKIAEGQAKQDEISELRQRVQDGRLSLSEERLEELNAQLEEKLIVFRRFQDDADRELAAKEKEALQKIERDILGIIGQVGKEQGYSLIFNKFRSGLVYADEAMDITNLVIERFNQASQSGS